MIYVDDLFTMTPRTTEAQKHGHRWCHLFTDNLDLEELHQFAEKLGLKRAWFQDHVTLPHYDLTPSKRAQAIRIGAKAVTGEEMKAVIMQEVRARRAEALKRIPDKDEATLREGEDGIFRARNVASAYELTQAIAEAEAAKQPREVPVFGDPLWINRSRMEPYSGRGCVIKVNGKVI